MSFIVSKVDHSPYISEKCNETLLKGFSKIVPTEKHMSELPLPKNLNIEPHYIPTEELTFLQACIDFYVHSDDVFVCSLPKCGSSWTQTIVWLLTHNLNYQNVDRKKQMGDFDEIKTMQAAREKIHHLLNENNNGHQLDESTVTKMVWNECFNMDSPRVIKSHLPVHFLPKAIWSKQAKLIYVVRNPRDGAVSEYHFTRNFFRFDIAMDDFVNGITNDTWAFGPRFTHILNYWKCKDLPNVLFIAYEDLVNDSFATMKMISEFLGCSYTDHQLKELTEYVSFDNMKKNKAINREDDLKSMEKQLNKERPDANFT